MIRKKLRVLISVIFFGFLFLNSNAQDNTVKNSLVGRWEFNDGTGKDLSGNENHAVINGTQIYSLENGESCKASFRKRIE